jgi:hypothetical protein
VEAGLQSAPAILPELITDRAIEEAEEDRFGHEDYVRRLIALVTDAPPPANIALFGRWGSGKTGICRRMRVEIDALPGFCFAHFDAFKLARTPLLRRFLIQIANDLGGEDVGDKYRRKLYESREEAEADEDGLWGTVLPWIAWFFVALGVAAALFGALVLLLPDDASHGLVRLAEIFAPAFIPTSALATLLGFAVTQITLTTTTAAPGSEEQFEELFSKLLKDQEIGDETGEKTLVCFVDELDRCSPQEVAATLSSLKTFLDEPGCIFIVAADQQVLERALTHSVRQATPRDVANPYYSAGSAYLDKIFGYQLSLPPVLPERLGDFALGLVTGRTGVWSHLADPADVTSVLLPVTVRSPRRIKVLLNSFAQTYALVQAREASGRMDKGRSGAVEEIAKLVCLRTEFPLFAAELAIHPELVSLVPECAVAIENGVQGAEELAELEGMAAAAPETRSRAMAYSTGKAAPDVMLEGKSDSPGGVQPDEVQAAQIDELIAYLGQTARIKGPRLDLIYLESRGAVHGIGGFEAGELETLALQGRGDELVPMVEKLGEEKITGAMQVLEDLIARSGANDRSNAVRSYLLLRPRILPRGTQTSRSLLGRVSEHYLSEKMSGEEMPGALALAIDGEDRTLERHLLADREALSNPLRGAALDDADSLLPTHRERLGELFARELAEEPDLAVSRLGDEDR